MMPAVIWGDLLIPSRPGSGPLSILNGEIQQREQPLTGERFDWRISMVGSCGQVNASEHLLLFRSNHAAFFDMEHDTGQGYLAERSFRSGCTANLIAADGVVNAIDYTRTCSCSYPIQTSLAMIHMPDDPSVAFWTRYHGAPPDPTNYGLNFGAPGRRVDVGGSERIWHDEPGTRRRHPSAIEDNGGGLDWVAASGRELGNGNDENKEAEPITVYDLLETEYTVRLHFAELTEGVEAGERVFDVLIDGEEVLSGYDIVAEAGGCFHGVVEEFTVDANMTMDIELRKAEGSDLDPFINGIEVVASDAELAAAE